MSTSIDDDPMASTFADEDQLRIEAILSFWFREQSLSAPQIDRRMDIWFGESDAFDQEIREEFMDDMQRASDGELDHWAEQPRGRLALILLLDQFRRNVYRGQADAFARDAVALKLCVEGALQKKDQGLTPIQRAFFYMPLQHAESRKAQKKSVALFSQLADAVSPTYRETFLTIAGFAELHHDIVEQFGRFPHRNRVLGRDNTAEEDEFLGEGTPDFGQG
ncbi:MAG: DUF924 family protein [Pseudomonadota bacterium]